MQPGSPDDVRAIIREAALRHRVARDVALAFAWVESRLIPTAEGDLRWHERDGGRLYRAHVLGNVRLNANPARLDPGAWHSYGLYQLNAAWHVDPREHPRSLLDPRTNASKGCAFIAHLLTRTGGDVEAARLLYIGAPPDFPVAAKQVVLANLRAARSRFAG